MPTLTAMNPSSRATAIKPFGVGRIVFWRGGSIWIGHVADAAGFHAHHAIQITLALSGKALHLRPPDEDWSAYQAAIVAAHQVHAFEARGVMVALVFVEPESREGQVLQARYSRGVAALDAPALIDQTASLAAAFENGSRDEVLAGCADAVIAKLTSLQPLPAKPLDQRIENAIELLRNRLDQSITMKQIAEGIHLSPERFRHLFLEQTGMRFRPYVLWLRIEVAVAAYAAGANLTEAAQTGGFADSAHFSRTFKRMFGVPAISVQRS